jgi:NAD(P)-dependent dehydrogenase (short-subunit alcohol dehydrogenase family)
VQGFLTVPPLDPATAPEIFAAGLFRGRTALVTGGGTGIGLAIAHELGRLGASVVIAARRREGLEAAATELRHAGIDATALPLNIRDERAVEALFDELASRGLGAEILVNNAGGQFTAAALDISANGFRAVVDLNLNGAWHMCHEFARRAVARGGSGRIVNIVLSIDGGASGYAHAAAARAGVINLSKTLAVEWAPHGILVNCVAPGTIRTSALDQYDRTTLDAAVAALPVKRMGEAIEVARTVAFLASPGGDYITGTTIFVDGGKHLARPAG